jgi:hypothetical protein
MIHGLQLSCVSVEWDNYNKSIDFHNIDELDIMNSIAHGHEPIVDLQKKFGIHLPIIAVKRDRHERFYSLYKHCIYDLYRCGADDVANFLKNITLDELFFFKKEDLLTHETRLLSINNFLLSKNLITKKILNFRNLGLNLNLEQYIVSTFYIMLVPLSILHNHNPNIIWFDIDNLSEMNKWVSDKIGKPFEIKKINSSKHIECDLKLDTLFVEKYNSVYDYYDLPKNIKTLL